MNPQKTFYFILGNNLIASIVNFTVWFAIIFFVYLQSQSVFATSILSGIYLVLSAATGIWFGSIVDHNKKKNVLITSSVASLILYSVSFALYLYGGNEAFKDISSPLLWSTTFLILCGVIAGNLRNIVIPTLVATMVEEQKREQVNGIVGTVSGVSFLITSIISGFLVGWNGMLGVFVLAITSSIVCILHLFFVHVEDNNSEHSSEEQGEKKIDIRGTLKVIQTIPGLLPLILFSTFNNFLGGVFMSLMDAYGLSLVSVQTWGILWGFLSTAFIVGGLLISKFGLGGKPLKVLFLTNIVIWVISSIFTLQESIVLLTAGMFVYLTIMPFIEAAEQTIFQTVVPVERLGRVFGFSQSVEQAASPLTAFLIGPLTQFIFIPFMTTGKGVEMIGTWFGTGANRGMALVFTITGIMGLIVTLFAMKSKSYSLLEKSYETARNSQVTSSTAI